MPESPKKQINTPKLTSIHLLGGLQLNGVTVGDISPKVLELLVCLLVNQGTPLKRETLASQLWGHLPRDRGLANLRRLLHKLQSKIPGLKLHIVASYRAIHLSATDLHCDLWALQALLESHPKKQALATLKSIYLGPLSPELNPYWVQRERERLEKRVCDSLTTWMDDAECNGALEMAIRLAKFQVQLFETKKAPAKRLERLLCLGRNTRTTRLSPHIGRSQLWRRLTRYFSDDASIKMVAVDGPPGSGKSHLGVSFLEAQAALGHPTRHIQLPNFITAPPGFLADKLGIHGDSFCASPHKNTLRPLWIIDNISGLHPRCQSLLWSLISQDDFAPLVVATLTHRSAASTLLLEGLKSGWLAEEILQPLGEAASLKIAGLHSNRPIDEAQKTHILTQCGGNPGLLVGLSTQSDIQPLAEGLLQILDPTTKEVVQALGLLESGYPKRLVPPLLNMHPAAFGKTLETLRSLGLLPGDLDHPQTLIAPALRRALGQSIGLGHQQTLLYFAGKLLAESNGSPKIIAALYERGDAKKDAIPFWLLASSDARTHGRLKEAEGHCLKALEHARLNKDAPKELEALIEFEAIHRTTGNHTARLQIIETLEKNLKNTPMGLPHLQVKRKRAAYYSSQGDLPKARILANECVNLAKTLGSPGEEIESQLFAASLHARAHDLDAGLIAVEAAEALAIQAGLSEQLCSSSCLKSRFLMSSGAWEKALNTSTQAIEVAERHGLKRHHAYALGLQGAVLFNRGSNAEAIKRSKQALALDVETGDRSLHLFHLCNLGIQRTASRWFGRARRDLEASLKQARALGRKQMESLALGSLGSLDVLTGWQERGMERLNGALELALSLGDQSRLTNAHLRLAEGFLRIGDATAAGPHSHQGYKLAKMHGNPMGCIRAQLLLGTQQNRLGQVKAEATLLACIEAAKAMSAPIIIRHAHQELAALALNKGNAKTALKHLQGVAKETDNAVAAPQERCLLLAQTHLALADTKSAIKALKKGQWLIREGAERCGNREDKTHYLNAVDMNRRIFSLLANLTSN